MKSKSKRDGSLTGWPDHSSDAIHAAYSADILASCFICILASCSACILATCSAAIAALLQQDNLHRIYKLSMNSQY